MGEERGLTLKERVERLEQKNPDLQKAFEELLNILEGELGINLTTFRRKYKL